MTPNTGAFLIYPEGTRTSKYAQDIRHRATTAPLREYIQDKYMYTGSIMNTINWGAHGKALKAMIKKRIHLTKLIHECLPTMERLNKFDSGKRKCPGCGECRETRDHIVKCQSENRQKWREKFFKSINEFHAKEKPIRSFGTCGMNQCKIGLQRMKTMSSKHRLFCFILMFEQ